MKRLLCACLAIPLLSGCGGSTAGTKADAPAPVDGPCVATMVSKTMVGDRRSTWTQVGTLTVKSETGNDVSSADLRDASGKSVPVEPIGAGGKGGAGRSWISAATCKVGGMFAFADPKKNPEPEKSHTMVFDLYRPTKDDPNRDIDELCTKPALVEGYDPSATMVLASSYYEENLSSRTWRVWLTNLTTELSAATDNEVRRSIRVRAGGELDRASKAASKNVCWWADQLRQ